jgi:hypothetical protein
MTAIVTKRVRRQLTLFTDQQDAENIEKIRNRFNPKQSALIRSHVTLCREDEIENLKQIVTNLHRLTNTEILIVFGQAIRFENGKGVLLPAKGDSADFQNLRRQILLGINNNPKMQEPHITLMHPRNSTCTDNIFEEIKKIRLPAKLKFKRINLIEQNDGGQWSTVQEFALMDKEP